MNVYKMVIVIGYKGNRVVKFYNYINNTLDEKQVDTILAAYLK